MCKPMIVTALLLGSMIPLAGGQKAPLSFSVESISLVRADTDSITFGVRLSTLSERRLTVQQARFPFLRLNGLWAHASPLKGPLTLIGGSRYNLPEIEMTVRFDDLDDVQPIQELLDSGKVRVEGQVVAELGLSAMERLFLFGREPILHVPFAHVVDVGLPELPRRTLAYTLPLLSSLMKVTASPLRRAQLARQTLRKHADETASEGMIVATSTFQFKRKNGEAGTVQTQRLGFRVSDEVALFPAELVEPWRYLPEIVAQVKSKLIVVNTESLQLELYFPRQKVRLTSANQDFTVGLADAETRRQLALQGKKAIRVDVGDPFDPSAVVEVKLGSQAPRGPVLAPDPERREGEFEAAIFRPILSSTGDWDFVITLVHCSTTSSSRYSCSPGAEPPAWGSPILTLGGYVGSVRSSDEGAVINRGARHVQGSSDVVNKVVAHEP